ncbi:leucine-rich repeat flightless-interacting protein 1 isoform X5 [Manis javanica]|uniref:leucine-rich repeat flightless-interacting protein 1 isoform X5 n=1 Tax=Manis javanica TaxID=9974 RepID=UPI003C6CE73E
MGTQGSGRRRLPNRERLNAEDDALNQIAREAEARLAAKRAARAEAREIRMKELERQQREIYQVQKKYYGLDTKWGDIEQWMASDEDERVSVGSRGSLRPDLEYGAPYTWTNGYEGELCGSQSLSRRSGRNSSYSGDSRFSSWSTSREDKLGLSGSDLGLPSSSLAPRPLSAQNGNRASVFDDSSLGGARWGRACGSHTPSEPSGHPNSSSRASSRASSARASPVVEERPEKDFTEKGSRSLSGLSAATLASLGGTSSRRGSGDTSISIDTEASIREIKELNELKDQIQDVEGKYMRGLKELKDSLAEVEEKYKKAMVSNAQLDNEKTNFMYQVDTLKDTLLGLEEQLAESRRQYEEKNKEFEREQHAHSVLRFQFAEVKEALKQREEMLEEIRQLQQKQAGYIREISDLQETIEWKDKKIGALERQKEFFDSVRSERDDLREEVVKLKEELKKHGIILNSEIATNGETSDTLSSFGYQGPTKMGKEELNALQTPGDEMPGRANEVEVKNEIVENEGKREILQHTEQEQHKEDPVKDRMDTEVSHPGEDAEDQKTSEDSASSLGLLAGAAHKEQVQDQVLENTPFLEETQQAQSREGTNTPHDRIGAPLELSKCLSELDGEIQGPMSGQESCNASDSKNRSEEPAEKQEKDKDDFKTNLGEAGTKPYQDPAPLQTAEAGSADTGGQNVSPMGVVGGAGLTGYGEQVGTVASSPPRYGDGTEGHDGTCAVGGPRAWDPSTGHGLEKELAVQEVAEPKGVPSQSTEVGGENAEQEDKEREPRGEKLTQTEVPGTPCSAAAQSSPQRTGPSAVDAGSEPTDTRGPDEEKSDQQADALDSSQKKTKNKKKKNKKKKIPAAAGTLNEVKKELTFQDPDLSEVKEEEQVGLTDRSPAVEAPSEAAEKPQQVVAGGSGDVDCPENPKIELDGKFNQDDDVNTQAEGDTLHFEDAAVPSSGTLASDKELDEGVTKDNGEEDATAQSNPPGPENEEAPRRALPERPSGDVNDASQTEGTEGHEMSEYPSQVVRGAPDGTGPEDDDLAPAGESDSRGTQGRGEKGKSREDCSLS